MADLKQLEGFFRAIGSQSRLKILLLFMDGQQRTVNEIAAAVGIGQSTCSEHLAVLKREGVMSANKLGKEVYYTPNKDEILAKLEQVAAMVRECC